MEYIFHSLSDIALRRVYKFVLKQTIGKFLKDDLLIDQLQVKTREGIVRIHDLALDCGKLNSEIEELPISISSASINLIEAHISYSTLLTESCRFVIDTITIHVEPTEPTVGQKATVTSNTSGNKISSPLTENDTAQQRDTPEGVPISDEAEEGLSFIAQWIEIIVAKLCIEINNIEIIFNSSKERGLRGISLSLVDLRFLNSDPSLFNTATSLEASRSVMNSIDLAQSLLSSTKMLSVGSINLASFANGQQQINILSTRGDSVIRVRPEAKDGSILLDRLDIDVNISPIEFVFNETVVDSIISIVNDISSLLKSKDFTSSTSLSKIFSKLKTNNGNFELFVDENQDEDESALNKSLYFACQRMKEKRATAVVNSKVMRALNSPYISPNFEIEDVDSDGDFPDNESDVSESEFHDAFDQKPLKVIKASNVNNLTISNLNMSTFGSKMFTSALAGSAIASDGNDSMDDQSGSFVRLRISMPLFTISFVDKISNILSIGIEDIVVIVESSWGKSSLVNIKSTIRDISIFERRMDSTSSIILSFDRKQDSKSIFSLPAISCEYASLQEGGPCSLEVTVQPIIISFDIPFISRWVNFITMFRMPPLGDSSSSVSIKTCIKLLSIAVIIHSDPNIPLNQWVEVLDSVRLDLNSSNWHEVRQLNESDLYQHMVQSLGGLNFSFDDVSLDLYPGDSGFCLTLARAKFEIFLRSAISSSKIFSSTIVSAKGSRDSNGETKLQIKLGTSDAILASSAANETETDRGLVEDMGPQQPKVDPSKMIFVSTQELLMEIQQREYNALIILSDLLVAHDSRNINLDAKTINTKKHQSSEDSAFCVVINTKKAFLVLGENEFVWWKSFRKSPAAAGKNDIFASLCGLCEQAFSRREQMQQQKVLKLCIAIQEPEIKIAQANKDIFVELKANDLSIFEMNPKEYFSLKQEGFDFFCAPRVSSRSGINSYKIPVIHRAYVRNNPDPKNSNKNGHLANHQTFGSAFEIRILLTETICGANLTDVMKCLHLFIDFYDIIINYDPSATWLLKLVKVLTPLTVMQSRYTNIAELLYFIDKQCSPNSFSESQLLLIDSARAYLANNLHVGPTNESNSSGSLTIPFEMTKVSARVRASLIDYFSVSTGTSLLLSADVIALSSTIVSNADKFSLKISLSNLAFYLSNNAFNFGLNENASNWKERNGYLEIVTIDQLATIVTIKNKQEQDVMLEFMFGSCLIQGCIDSLMLLMEWFTGFETACLEVDNIQTLPTSNVSNISSEADTVDLVDRFRMCTSEDENIEEIISNELIDGLMDTTESIPEENRLGHVPSPSLMNGVMEDYYGANDHIRDALEEEHWIADYDYDDHDTVGNENNLGRTIVHQDSRRMKFQGCNDEEDEVDCGNSLSNSVLLFSKPSNITADELELQPLDLPKNVVDNLCWDAEAVQPGMTEAELIELGELEKAWEDVGHTKVPSLGNDADGSGDEQKAFWYKQFIEPEIDFQYLNKALSLQSQRAELLQSRPEIEKNQAHDIVVVVQGNVTVKLFEGSEWTDKVKQGDGEPTTENHSRKEKSSLEIHLSGIHIQVFSYRLISCQSVEAIPKERVVVMIKDTVVIYNSGKVRNKVLGPWKSSQRPWDDTKSMISCTVLAYSEKKPEPSLDNHDLHDVCKTEHRLYLTLLPVRCFLTEEFIQFVKNLVESQKIGVEQDIPSTEDSTVSEQSNVYFQTIVIEQADMKIDYKASYVNIANLQNGDYLQLLNIFPIDGLELTFKSIRLNGVSDMSSAGNHILETWVKDIYKNQLHRVIAGAAPLKSIANITNDMHSLFFAGGESKKTGNKQVVHHLQKGTKALATTIAREALDVTHKLTMFVAQTITDLASDPDEGKTQLKASKQPKNIGEGLHRAVDSVSRELSGAAETVIAVPIKQYERTGTTGVLRSVVRALPVAVLRPIAGVAEGVSYTILGFRNHLDPTLKRDEEDMWDVGEIPR